MADLEISDRGLAADLGARASRDSSELAARGSARFASTDCARLDSTLKGLAAFSRGVLELLLGLGSAVVTHDALRRQMGYKEPLRVC